MHGRILWNDNNISIENQYSKTVFGQNLHTNVYKFSYKHLYKSLLKKSTDSTWIGGDLSKKIE